MSKKANISYQFTSSINDAFTPGADRHSIKKSEGSDHRIYSYASRSEMIDFSKQFSRFMKENFPEIRQVKEITVEHINGFLSTRTNVTEKTIRHDVSCINKLELCCSKKFGLKDLDWRTGREVPQVEKVKIRDAVFTEEQVKTLNAYLETKRDSDSKTAIYLGERFALRASEICKLKVQDVRINQDGSAFLHIHEAKGKRSRDIAMTPDDVRFIKEIIADKKLNERIVECRPNSINAYLHRASEVLNFKSVLDAKSGFHAMRKYSARKFYQEKLVEFGPKVAREMTMKRLGHSANRSDLCHIYLGI